MCAATAVSHPMLDPVILDLLKRTREQQLERRNHYGTLHVRNFIDRYGYLNQNGDGEEMEFLMVREDGSFLHRTVIDHASKVIKRELGHQQFISTACGTPMRRN